MDTSKIGNIGCHENVEQFESFLNALAHKNKSSLVGTGIVPEGFFQNEIVYDYTLQLQYNGYDDDYFVENWIMARYNLTYNKV